MLQIYHMFRNIQCFKTGLKTIFMTEPTVFNVRDNKITMKAPPLK